MREDDDAPTKVDEPQPSRRRRRDPVSDRGRRPLTRSACGRWRIGYAVGRRRRGRHRARDRRDRLRARRDQPRHAAHGRRPRRRRSRSPTPSTALTQAWSSTDATAIGTPYSTAPWSPTTSTPCADATRTTGKQTWSYTRTDRTVCTAMQSQSVDRRGLRAERQLRRADRARLRHRRTPLDPHARQGRRRVQRTRRPTRSDGSNVMFVSRTSIYAYRGTADQGNGGLDYWTFHHVGCTINSAVLGTAGALISQTCTARGLQRHEVLRRRHAAAAARRDDRHDDKSTDQPRQIVNGTTSAPTSSRPRPADRHRARPATADAARCSTRRPASRTRSSRSPATRRAGSAGSRRRHRRRSDLDRRSHLRAEERRHVVRVAGGHRRRPPTVIGARANCSQARLAR